MDASQHARSQSAPTVDTTAAIHLNGTPLPAPETPTAARTEAEETLKPRDVHNTNNPAATPGPNPFWDPSGFHKAYKNRPKAAWHKSSNLNWREKWTEKSWCQGRVLLVDYIRQDRAGAGKVKIAATEIDNVHKLHAFYSDSRRCQQAALRLIHVQDAPWAVLYLMKKFNINSRDDLVGMDFAKWARFSTPEWRAGKPLLKGKTWRTQLDPWRGIRRTAFGLDYLKAVSCEDEQGGSHAANSDAGRRSQGGTTSNNNNTKKMMELNCYDEADAATYGYDVFVQRLSVYLQLNDPDATPPEDIKNPYGWHGGDETKPGQKNTFPPLERLDNGNTIIIFENSKNKSVTDTLIGARQQMESRWRRLSFFLPQKDLADDEKVAAECVNLILQDLFKGLEVSWESFLSICETHISILEDKIYESPADETRAPELWYNSSAWLKVEKLIYIHLDLVKETATHLAELAPSSEDSIRWLEGSADAFERIANLVQEDLVKPTTAMGDLLYKSVGIRDSRQSLGLSTSMWRLSWITFIFLPLTFIVGFFGMNVDIFANDPNIAYYFAAAVPLMLLVLILWYVLKHALAATHQTPYQRGVYEHLFHDLATSHPDLWSRAGPRQHIHPSGLWDRLRWQLLTRWFDPSRTVARQPSDPDEDVGGSGLGTWARVKRALARRWLRDIRVRPGDVEAAHPLVDDASASALTDLVAVSSDVAAATGGPHAVTLANLKRLGPPVETAERRSSAGNSGSVGRPSSSAGSSGMMVEERDLKDEEDDEWLREGLAGSRVTVRRSIDGVISGFGAGLA